MRAGDIMNRKVVTVSPHASVREAARLMREHNIGTLVVVDEEYPVGIITERDLATRVVALDLSGDTPVGDVMSTQLIHDAEAWFQKATRAERGQACGHSYSSRHPWRQKAG